MSYKYPRTLHLPWSEGITNDDKVMKDVPFIGKDVVVTVKMDGENTSMYRDNFHARSLDSPHHESRSWAINYWNNQVRYQLPEGDRVCGENLYAEHSIKYDRLPSYFMGYSYWTRNTCRSWDFTWERFKQIGITPVYVAYKGIYDKGILKEIWEDIIDEHEGYVVRLAGEFEYEDFAQSVAKFVRKGHVQTNKHWMHQEIVPNKLEKK